MGEKLSLYKKKGVDVGGGKCIVVKVVCYIFYYCSIMSCGEKNCNMNNLTTLVFEF